jgi:hypothetical protein
MKYKNKSYSKNDHILRCRKIYDPDLFRLFTFFNDEFLFSKEIPDKKHKKISELPPEEMSRVILTTRTVLELILGNGEVQKVSGQDYYIK